MTNREGARATARPDSYLAAIGDVNDVGTWSGTPYYFLVAGRAAGIFDGGLALLTDTFPVNARRFLWNLAQLVSRRGRGGYQYSVDFLEKLWRGRSERLAGAVVMQCFQLLPPSAVADPSIEKWFFIDQTLRQLFEYYGEASRVSDRMIDDALRRETEGYRSARGIITNSRWARNNVIEEYGIEPEKVHILVPGPSLDPVAVAKWESAPPKDYLQLVFVGKDWYRKGLDRLLEAVALLRSSGADVRLRVIGCSPRSVPRRLRDVSGVEWLGFVSKARDVERFISAVGGSHLGCLLSRKEAGGIALREYHALGLPVLGPDTGGAPEHMVSDASIAVSPEASPREIAEVIRSINDDRGRLRSLADAARAARASVSWTAVIARLADFWPHSLQGEGSR